MTIQRDGRNQYLECEECTETTEPFDRDDFAEMIQSAKDAGWQIKQDSRGAWLHHCPGCSDSGSRLARAQALFR